MSDLVVAIKGYPRVREVIVVGARSQLDIESREVKKILFMLVAHSLLRLHYDQDDKKVVFQIGQSKFNETLLAIQCNELWQSLNGLVNIDN